MVSRTLPEGWEWRNLGGVEGLKAACEFLDRLRVPVNGKERAKRQGPYPYYGANGQQGWIDDYIFNEELVLLAEDGGFFFDPTKPTAYRVSGKCWVNNHAHVLRPAKDVNPDWLCFCLAYADYIPFIPEPVRPKLNQKNAKRIPILVPPLSEQRRIVDRIEQLTSRLEKARALQRKAVEATGMLCSSAIENMVLSACEEFEKKSISQVVVDAPNWNSRLQPKESFEYVEISGVDNNAATIVKTRQVNGQNAPSRAKRLVYSGDVIFATTRPYLKNIAIIPDKLDDQICSTGFCVLRPNLNLVNSKWLYYVVRSDYVMNQIIVGQEKNAYPSVSNDEVLSAAIPVPPVKTQERYIRCLEKSQAKAEQLKQIQAKTEAELEKLMPALLAKAFRGEL